MDWLLNSLEEGEEKPANDYQIEGYTQDIWIDELGQELNSVIEFNYDY